MPNNPISRRAGRPAPPPTSANKIVRGDALPPAAQASTTAAATSATTGTPNPTTPTTGTVTSVGLTAPAEFTVTGSPVTAAGTLAFAKANQAANRFWAGPTSGGAAAPAFRAIVAADLPIVGLDINAVVAGCDPTGGVDNTALINSLISTVAQAGGLLYFPAGTYKISSALVLPNAALKRFALRGAGRCTNIVQVGTGNGLSFDYTQASVSPTAFNGGVDISELSFLADDPSNVQSATAIFVNGGAATVETSNFITIRNVHIGTVFTGQYVQNHANAGWTYGIHFLRCNQCLVEDSWFHGNTDKATFLHGTYGDGTGGAGSGRALWCESGQNCFFSRLHAFGWGMAYALSCPTSTGGDQPQGMFYTDINAVSVGEFFHMYGDSTTYPNGLAAVWINGYQCDNGQLNDSGTKGIKMEYCNSIFIQGGLDIQEAGLVAIRFSNCSDCQVLNCRSYTAAGSSINYSTTASSSDITFTGNRVIASGLLATGLTIDAGCNRITNVANNYHGSTTALADAGTATISANNQ